MLIMVFLCVSIIVFRVAIKPMIPSLNIRCVLYLVLIFSAESFTYRFMQATYRLGVVVPCVFLVFSGYIALFLRRDESVKNLFRGL